MSSKSVFILGASGYIGGSVFIALRERYPDLQFTALVRNPAHFDKLRAAGAAVVPGSFTDVDIVAEQSYLADVVINAADADDLALTNAILKGIKRRADEGKPKGVLIHTSGSAVFLDGGKEGRFDPEARIWNDNNERDIKDITAAMIHGHVDVPILEAGNEGYVEAYIISPGAIVGDAKGPINNGTFFLKFLVQVYTMLQSSVYVGEGTNHFAIVHIDDVADLFLRVFERSQAGVPEGESPYARYFLATSNGVEWKTIATSVGAALARRTVLADGTPKVVSVGDLDPSIQFLGSSERVEADRSKSLGWNPRVIDLEDYVQPDIDAALDGMH
ncbi:NAD(P)-binding protein [Artomyces pyxidatus]|uniref:NAD(P)-binding protein n=1 Tax=Artomyces pyxidatus TaxID=48021 RepID=A0ACB8SIX6_9AGAM|nr:NAD(P)-binding protein [Artomyces pyxidatus]